jgi:integrase
MKNGQDLGIPLNDMAIAVLEAQKGKHAEYVFTYKGKPIGSAGTRAWRQALERAGIADFRFHDLRHTWASWLMQSDASEFMVQQLGGWKSRKMVERYAALQTQHLAPAARLIDRVVSGAGTNVAQLPDFRGTLAS